MMISVLYYLLCDRFNRYIVECKYVRSKGKEFDGFSFNRYIVECKFYQVKMLIRIVLVLIDT